MIRRLQLRFILTASSALLIVLFSVVGVINGAMRGILQAQTIQVLRELPFQESEARESVEDTPGFVAGTMLTNHYFRALFDGEETLLELDLDSAPWLGEEDAEAIARQALAQGSHGGRVVQGDTLYSYRVSQRSEQGVTALVLLDCTPAVNMVDALLRTSVFISMISFGGFVILISLFSRRAIRPVVENMDNQKRFITNASHELKTPLAIISANTELLEAMNGENEWTRNTLSQVARMTQLVGELVTLSRLSEQGRTELREIDFSAVVTQCAEGLSPVALQQGKAFTREIAPQAAAIGEEKLLRMLVSILLDNAVKYCDDGGRIDLRLSAKGQSCLLVVSNDYADGAGVNYARFFERFYQEDQSHNSKKSGFGIGLSTAQEIVQRMKGSIRVDYRDGRIAFRLTLPAPRHSSAA